MLSNISCRHSYSERGEEYKFSNIYTFSENGIFRKGQFGQVTELILPWRYVYPGGFVSVKCTMIHNQKKVYQ